MGMKEKTRGAKHCIVPTPSIGWHSDTIWGCLLTWRQRSENKTSCYNSKINWQGC